MSLTLSHPRLPDIIQSPLYCDQHFDHLIHDIQFDPLFLYLGHPSLFGCCCSAVSADKQVGALKCGGRVHACFGVGLPADLFPGSKHFLGFSSPETCNKQFLKPQKRITVCPKYKRCCLYAATSFDDQLVVAQYQPACLYLTWQKEELQQRQTQ